MSIHELQAALRALDGAEQKLLVTVSVDARDRVREARLAAIEAARRVAEGAGEPVAWRWPGGVWQDGDPSLSDKAQLKAAGVTPEFAYTTPPSADALAEALGKLSAEWRCTPSTVEMTSDMDTATAATYDRCADDLDAALAQHKENTDGR